MGLKTLQFQRLLFLSAVLVLRNAVAVPVSPSTSPQQHNVKSAINLSSRPQRDMTGVEFDKRSSQCPAVDECLAKTAGPFKDGMIHFSIADLYQESLTVCSKPPVQDCWDDACDDYRTKHLIKMVELNIARVCINQDALQAASVCDKGALGDKFNACGQRAYLEIMRHALSFNPIDFAKQYLACGYDVIDSIPLPCKEENKTFLKSYFGNR